MREQEKVFGENDAEDGVDGGNRDRTDRQKGRPEEDPAEPAFVDWPTE